MLDEIVKSRGKDALINIIVSTNAKENAISGVDEWRKRLVVKIKERPERGRANKAIIKLFAELFHLSEAEVSIVSGERSNQKTLKVGIEKEKVLKYLNENLKGRQ